MFAFYLGCIFCVVLYLDLMYFYCYVFWSNTHYYPGSLNKKAWEDTRCTSFCCTSLLLDCIYPSMQFTLISTFLVLRCTIVGGKKAYLPLHMGWRLPCRWQGKESPNPKEPVNIYIGLLGPFHPLIIHKLGSFVLIFNSGAIVLIINLI